MPSHSKYLSEEGMCTKSFMLVEKGVFQEEGYTYYLLCYSFGLEMCTFVCHYLGLTELLMAPGKIPGSSGTRNLHDNLSDLRAQVAANQKVCTVIMQIHKANLSQC